MAVGDPLDPKGPGSQQPPVDPGVADQMNRMGDRLREADALADAAERFAAAAEKASSELNKAFKGVEKEADAYKELIALAKKKTDALKREWKDSATARKELERIVWLHEEALKNTEQTSKQYKQMTRNLAEVKQFMGSLPKSGDVLNEKLIEANDMMKKIATNAKDVAKAFSGMGRAGTSIRGIAGIFEAAGIGKVASNIDRRLQQVQNVKDAVQESKDMRGAATRKHMGIKRAKAMDEMKEQHKAGGLSVDPTTGKVMEMFDAQGGMTSGGRHSLATKMGFKQGSKKYTDFVAGEGNIAAAGGNEAAGGAGWVGAMSEGGGAMESLSGVIETVTTVLTDIAPEIVILIGVIEVLSELFGSYTKQNKELEKGVGKGGLFTQPGMGAGDAFMNARNALTPGGSKLGMGTFMGAGLGINWERNLAMASQLTDSGMAAFPGMMGADVANQKPGAMGEFMQGGVGEMQRIVMGAGRVGGLDDK